MYLMSRKIKASGIKMVLSGEGADEVHGVLHPPFFPERPPAPSLIAVAELCRLLGERQVLGGYLYFHKAPNKEEFHMETVRKLKDLHYYGEPRRGPPPNLLSCCQFLGAPLLSLDPGF